jgi:dihydroxy-acid dehydratase
VAGPQGGLLFAHHEFETVLRLDEFDAISRRTPYITNVKPSGEYLMEEFFYAGGLPVVIKEILHLLHAGALTVTGKSIGENVAGAQCHNRDVIRTASEPLHAEGGTAVLYGNVAPHGAVVKQTAASADLLRHRGRAYVFENYEEMREQIDRDDLPVDKDTVLVMKSCGPKGAPGFRSGVTSRCRRFSSTAASPTWCASATPA